MPDEPGQRARPHEPTSSLLHRVASQGSLRYDVAGALLANGLQALTQWVLVIVWIRTYPQEQLGHYFLAVSLTAPVFLFFALNLRAIQATDAEHRYDFSSFVATRALTTCAALLVSMVLVPLAPGGSLPWFIAAAVIGVRVAEAATDVVQAEWQRQRLVARSSAFRIVQSLAQLAVGLAATAICGRVAQPVAAVAIGSLALLLCVQTPALFRASPRSRGNRATPRASEMRALVRLGIPLGIASTLSSLTFNVPRYFLAAACGPACVAVYSASAQLLMIGGTCLTAAFEAVRPRLALSFLRNRGAFRTQSMMILGGTLAFGGLCTAVAGAFGQPLLAALYSEEYAEQPYLLLLVMTAGAAWFAGAAFMAVLTAAGQYGQHAPIALGGVLATAAAAAVVVRPYGPTGAALALAAGMLVRLALYGWVTRQKFVQWAATISPHDR